MHVEMWPIERVKPYDRNPRQNDGGVEAVARSLREFGFRQPLVVDDAGVVVVGHTRLKAAQSLGMVEVPVHVAAGLTPEQARAYRIADNQTSNLSAWDYDKLRLEAVDLEALGVDLDLLGFGDAELAEIMAKPAGELGDPEEIPEPPKEPKTRLGDLWVLGKHRLLCGDSTVATDVDRLMGGEKADAVVTDPPYGIGFGYDQHDDGREKWFELMNAVVPMLRGMAPFVVMPCCGIDRLDWWYKNHRPDWMMCWYKGSPGHRSHVGFNDWEAHLVWGKPPGPMHDYWQTACGFEVDGHPCPKPVAYASWLVERACKAGGLLYEPFGGSGTTLVVAEQLARKCYAMELSPVYCDVIVARWEKFTGGKAELEARDG